MWCAVMCASQQQLLVAQVQKSKAGTGRVVGFRELGLVNAFTMEASFAGAAVGKYAKQHFNAGVMETVLTGVGAQKFIVMHYYRPVCQQWPPDKHRMPCCRMRC
jgi:hypothetical protein